MTSAARERFGREYYRRFYRDGRTSVTSRREMAARAQLIAAYTRHIDCPVASILDAGCGLGLMRTPLLPLLASCDCKCRAAAGVIDTTSVLISNVCTLMVYIL